MDGDFPPKGLEVTPPNVTPSFHLGAILDRWGRGILGGIFGQKNQKFRDQKRKHFPIQFCTHFAQDPPLFKQNTSRSPMPEMSQNGKFSDYFFLPSCAAQLLSVHTDWIGR